jgi:hypothetical protein
VRQTIKQVMAEYGIIALVLYLLMFTLVLLGAYAAIKAGWAPQGVAGKTGTWVVAYLIAKSTSPIRIAAAVALSPIVARVIDRLRGRPLIHPKDEVEPRD